MFWTFDTLTDAVEFGQKKKQEAGWTGYTIHTRVDEDRTLWVVEQLYA